MSKKKLQNNEAKHGKLCNAVTETRAEKRRRYSMECHSCKHHREVPGNSHIKCVKPDMGMVGNEHGIKNGWIMYPYLFNPICREKDCKNYESVSHAVSNAVSANK